MTSTAKRSFATVLAQLALLGCTACAPIDAEDESLGVTEQALDNSQADPDDGKTCYVDGPIAGMGKGKMDDGFCCVDRSGEQTCYLCTDPEYECQIAGGDVGAITIGTTATSVSTSGMVNAATITTSASDFSSKLSTKLSTRTTRAR